MGVVHLDEDDRSVQAVLTACYTCKCVARYNTRLEDFGIWFSSRLLKALGYVQVRVLLANALHVQTAWHAVATLKGHGA